MYVSHNNPIISHYTTMFLGFGSPFLVDQLPKTKHPSIYKLVFPRFVHHIISYSNMFHVFSPYVPIISPMFPMGFSRIPEAASSEASAAAPASQHLVHRRGKAHGGRL